MPAVSRNKIWRVRLAAYAPILLWIGVIFLLSSDAGSAIQTAKLIRPLLHFLFPSAPESTIRLYHHYVRKAAHFTEYAVLAGLLCRTVWILRPAFQYWAIAAVGIVTIIACLDEINQSFVSSRTASVYDSLLDISGGLFAVLTIWLVRRRRRTET